MSVSVYLIKLTLSNINLFYFYSLYDDTRVAELQYGKINFDNIGNALLTVFQCLTLEGWVNVMNNFQDAYDKYFTAIYFIALVLVCSLLLINLIVAVLLDKLRENQIESHSDDKYEELVQELVDLGFSKTPENDKKTADDPLKDMGCAEFLISHELNLLKSKEGTSKMQFIKDSCSYFFKNPKITYPKGGYFQKCIVKCIYYLVNHPLFHLLIFISIIVNTIIL